ncbi:drug/metabolite transporter [Tanacetum coccineum]
MGGGGGERRTMVSGAHGEETVVGGESVGEEEVGWVGDWVGSVGSGRRDGNDFALVRELWWGCEGHDVGDGGGRRMEVGWGSFEGGGSAMGLSVVGVVGVGWGVWMWWGLGGGGRGEVCDGVVGQGGVGMGGDRVDCGWLRSRKYGMGCIPRSSWEGVYCFVRGWRVGRGGGGGAGRERGGGCGNEDSKGDWRKWEAGVGLRGGGLGLSGMDIISKVALNEGMSNYVFVVYRHAVATVVMAPFAIVLDKYISWVP